MAAAAAGFALLYMATDNSAYTRALARISDARMINGIVQISLGGDISLTSARAPGLFPVTVYSCPGAWEGFQTHRDGEYLAGIADARCKELNTITPVIRSRTGLYVFPRLNHAAIDADAAHGAPAIIVAAERVFVDRLRRHLSKKAIIVRDSPGRLVIQRGNVTYTCRRAGHSFVVSDGIMMQRVYKARAAAKLISGRPI
jgi:hypothetical protein